MPQLFVASPKHVNREETTIFEVVDSNSQGSVQVNLDFQAETSLQTTIRVYTLDLFIPTYLVSDSGTSQLQEAGALVTEYVHAVDHKSYTTFMLPSIATAWKVTVSSNKVCRVDASYVWTT